MGSDTRIEIDLAQFVKKLELQDLDNRIMATLKSGDVPEAVRLIDAHNTLLSLEGKAAYAWGMEWSGVRPTKDQPTGSVDGGVLDNGRCPQKTGIKQVK